MILVLLLLLNACAGPELRELKTWTETANPKAESGEMLWSDYYTQLYDRMSKVSGVGDQGFYLNLFAQIIDAAKSYEAGKVRWNEVELTILKLPYSLAN